MTLSLVSTFGSAGSGWASEESGSPSTVSMSVTCGNVGDLVIVLMVTVASDLPSSMADSNSKITWDGSAVVSVASDGNGFATALWKGTVNSTGATSIDPSGGDYYGIYACELHESAGSPTWAAVQSGSNDGSASTATFPSLTSNTVTDQAYIGGLLLNVNGSTGSTSGFSYLRTSLLPSVLTWNLALGASTAYQPTCPNGGSGAFDTLGVIISASTSTNASPTAGVGNVTVAGLGPTVTANGSITVNPGKANVTVAALQPTVTVQTGGGRPTLPSDTTVGTPTWRMICWGGPGFTNWTLESQVTNETSYGFYGFEATDFSGTPSSSYVSLMNTANVESYFGLHWLTTTTSTAMGTLAGQVAAATGTGMGFDTEQATWSSISNSAAQALGNATAQAMWGAYPGLILVWYHYFPPGGWNDVYENSGLHALYQQDYLFLGMLAGMNAVGATGRIVLMDASFYRDAFNWEAGATNQAAYYLNSQGSRAQLSQFFDQTTWNFAVDHFDIAGFTWRGSDGTPFYNNTEPTDSEWVQSITDARTYSEGSRRAEYLWNDALPPVPSIPAGTPTFTYTSGATLVGSQAQASQTPLTTSVPTLTGVAASISAGTVTITCAATHAYGIRGVKVYNGSTFNPANPATSYLGAMVMTFMPNGGSFTTNYNSAYQSCTFSTSGSAGQWFVLGAISIKDDVHWAEVQVPGGTGTNPTAGTGAVVAAGLQPIGVIGAAPTVAAVTATAGQPVISVTAIPGVANVAVAAYAPSATFGPTFSANAQVVAYNPTIKVTAAAGVAIVSVTAGSVSNKPPETIEVSAQLGLARWTASLGDERWDADLGAARWDSQIGQPRWTMEVNRFA